MRIVNLILLFGCLFNLVYSSSDNSTCLEDEFGNICNDHGDCVDDECVCEYNWDGDDCSVLLPDRLSDSETDDFIEISLIWGIPFALALIIDIIVWSRWSWAPMVNLEYSCWNSCQGKPCLLGFAINTGHYSMVAIPVIAVIGWTVHTTIVIDGQIGTAVFITSSSFGKLITLLTLLAIDARCHR